MWTCVASTPFGPEHANEGSPTKEVVADAADHPIAAKIPTVMETEKADAVVADVGGRVEASD